MFVLNNGRSSANSRRKILRSPNMTPLLQELSLSILSIYIMKRRGERIQPCCSPTLIPKGFFFMQVTQTQTSDCLYNDWIQLTSHFILQQYCPQLVSWNTVIRFFKVYKAYIRLFGIFPQFLKSLLKAEIWSLVDLPGRNPHCAF